MDRFIVSMFSMFSTAIADLKSNMDRFIVSDTHKQFNIYMVFKIQYG